MSKSSSDVPSDPPDPANVLALVDPVTLTFHRTSVSDLDTSTVIQPPKAQPQLNGSPPEVASQAATSDIISINPPIALVSAIVTETIPPPSIDVAEEQQLPPTIDDTQLQWAARFQANLRNLSKASQPTFTEDGTPKVRAPASVILKASDTWKDHLVAHFHGNPPPPGKIFVDLNPIWGREGRINIRCLPNGIVLIFIPSEATRQWVLEVGCWQAGNCLFSVSAWSPTASLTPLKLVSLPIWVILKDVPPQLYSLPGLSTIASGIGEPLHTEKHQLPPLTVDTRIKVEILLKKNLPQSVLVADDDGNEVRVWVEYPRLPPKCDFCKEFGHLYHRCPTAPVISTTSSPTENPSKSQQSLSTTVTPRSDKSFTPNQGPLVPSSGQVATDRPVSGSIAVIPMGKINQQSLQSKSTHKYFSSPVNDSPSEWQVVSGRSKLPKSHDLVEVVEIKGNSITATQFAEEEEAIQNGQRNIRKRSESPSTQNPPPPPMGKISDLTQILEGSAASVVPVSVSSHSVALVAPLKKDLVRSTGANDGPTLPKKPPTKSKKGSTSGRSPGKGRPLHRA